MKMVLFLTVLFFSMFANAEFLNCTLTVSKAILFSGPVESPDFIVLKTNNQVEIISPYKLTTAEQNRLGEGALVIIPNFQETTLVSPSRIDISLYILSLDPKKSALTAYAWTSGRPTAPVTLIDADHDLTVTCSKSKTK